MILPKKKLKSEEKIGLCEPTQSRPDKTLL